MEVQNKPLENHAGDKDHAYNTGHLRFGNLIKANDQIHEQGNHRNELKDAQQGLHVAECVFPEPTLSHKCREKNEAREVLQNAIQMRCGVMDANVHPRLFTREAKELDIVPLRLHLGNMKTTRLSARLDVRSLSLRFGLLLHAGHQTCSAYQKFLLQPTWALIAFRIGLRRAWVPRAAPQGQHRCDAPQQPRQP